ncbi:peroxiredoxin [Rhodalgimonas zhirmunskyi]|uniref:thioredoxin-dependent peroxiredoxin n=1 Tax=Rhodalgimonas zhirmunskyi TaxID=2964767 RepID=A0AAJ1U951_9RHOB|nr:peroxiredoxin [Rhodoalgimonas zhirmunskyi]MDQ2095249.1 peroxiredoxin [Rhodoalgimonas zhirmunskyi]
MSTLPRPAPEFTLPCITADGESAEITLSALRPAPVVLFFYPRDNTSGCTKESQAFSHLLPEFNALGTKVFGISKDSLKSHARFIDKQELTIPLLSDENGTTCEDYGVWQEKKMYGKTHMGIVRSTFLIDAKGEIVKDWPKVKVDGHAEEVLAALKDMG